MRNRIAVSPMCMYSATEGLANDWHLVHLGSRAVGGAGVVMVEATGVVPEARITPGCLGLWSDAHVPMLKRIAGFLREHGAAPAIQLAHAGRKASHATPPNGGKPLAPGENGGWQTVGPTAQPFLEGAPPPAALDEAGIAEVIAAFRTAAVRARHAGFQIAEVHAAHGYLLHQFYSPLINTRTDAWGGTFDNRIRLTLKVTRAVREVWPADLPVWVRISASDWAEGGWGLAQSTELAQQLRALGVDLIDCSSGGGVAHQKIAVAPGYQVPFAAAIRRDAGIATGAVGLITDASQADAIIRGGDADVVLLARAELRDPYWPLHAAQALGVEVAWPSQYLRGKP
jgi:2,4-dienoyl-CoA reductase-like NADH-dependent reductase (Old Yellow Enzyme family)